MKEKHYCFILKGQFSRKMTEVLKKWVDNGRRNKDKYVNSIYNKI